MTRHQRPPAAATSSTAAPNPPAGERGSSAVEFALVVPVLLLIVIGIIEFGFVFNSQLQVTAAARDAARVASISAQPGTALAQARQAAVDSAGTVAIDPASVQITITPAGTATRPCPPGSTATVTIRHAVPLLTGLLGPTLQVTGKGVMQCGV